MSRAIDLERLKCELDVARRSGTLAEVTDLELLIQNAGRAPGEPHLPGARAAANRQAQRRYGRNRTHDQNGHNRQRSRKPTIGDWVEDPGGARWTVTQIVDGMLRHDTGVPGETMRGCPIELVKLVDGPLLAESPTAQALYHAAWDALEAGNWDALERALRVYEASTP